MEPKADLFFELSWEVCNKVGGINTVIKSKVPQTQKIYRNNYFLIGPYFQDNANNEFQEKVPPEIFHEIFKSLKREGIVAKYGKWLIKGEPDTILFDFHEYTGKNYEIKGKLWEAFRIDSLGTEFHDFDEPILWGSSVGKFLEKFIEKNENKKIVAQFHEWLSCGALLYLKRKGVKIGTVFTTHGTMLGRTLAGNRRDLYENISKINPKKEAYRYNVHPKYLVEKISAKVCNVFTTVSEILSLEAENFFGVKPEVLLYNGLNLSDYPTFEEISLKHRLYREKIKEFFKYFFFPYYTFDLDNTFIYFITGRYEFHNKGIDILIKSLAKLNKQLKEEKSKRTIVVFFWIPRETIRIKPDISQRRAYYEDLKSSVAENIKYIEGKIINQLIAKKPISGKSLFSKEFIFEQKKKVFRLLKFEGDIPLCTHDLQSEEKDLILKSFKTNDLLNREEDRVKVVFYPIYLSGADNLLGLDYNESILGSHLGIFPSYYEPWGYTPLETSALGVASITTDFAGFGRYLKKQKEGKNGIFVVDMFGKNMLRRVENLYNTIYKFSKLSKEERIKNKVVAQKIASMADWEKLIENYVKAHNLAIEKEFMKNR